MTRIAKALLFFPIIVFLLNGCTSSLEDGLPGSDDQTVTYHSTGWKDNPQHGNDYYTDPQNCKACHGEDLDGGTSGVSCRGCHHSGWSGTHGEEYAADPDNCKACHGEDLNGGDASSDCSSCHHEDAVGKWQHGDYHTLPDTDNCADCHGADLTGANSLVSCFSCHSDISAFNCSNCHTGAAISYADSAHGNTSYGVDRSGTGTEGDCIHCHDLPAGSTNDLLLFAPMNQTSQTENFCFQCHKDKDTGDNPVQIGMPQQRSYSYRAGGWTADPLDDVKEAFSGTSSHNLDNILTFITGRWGYTSDSNPCAACHNPHAAQRDPHVAGDRGWPVTLPSKHGSSVAGEQLWGDDAGEKISDYTGQYQAPYRNGGAGYGYEPDGSDTTDGSNLTCYATFCQDCHMADMGAAPYDFGLSNTPIDWTIMGGESGGDKHGNNVATSDTHFLNEPYAGAWTTSGLVLSCTDCHEPHGASNEMLVREEVNGAQVTIGSIGFDDADLEGLCLRCHQDDIWSIHHTDGGNADAPYTGGADCDDCHFYGWSTGPTSICSNCHFHGGDDSWLQTSPYIANGNLHYTGRRTF